jgi:AcrR family transcriptional regulator
VSLVRTHRRLFDADDAPSKAAILQRALTLFVRDGLCETSIRDIAHAAGYTNPALYKFFPSKEALALHLFERCYGYVADSLAAAVAGDATFPHKLDALLAAFLDLIETDLDAVIYTNETLRQFWRKLPPSARARSILTILRGLLEQGRRERAVRRELDVSLAIAVIVGGLSQIARMAYFKELEKPYVSFLPSLRALMEGALC